MSKCSNCGQECPDSARFCPNCGAKLEDGNKTVVLQEPAGEPEAEKTVFAVEEPATVIAEEPAATVPEETAQPSEAPAADSAEEPSPAEEAAPAATEEVCPATEADEPLSEEAGEEPSPIVIEEFASSDGDEAAPASEELAPVEACDNEPPKAAPSGDPAAQQGLLDKLYRFMKYQKLAWKITGIYFVCICLLFIVVGGIMSLVSILAFVDGGYGTEGIAAFSLGFGFTWFLMGLLYAPIAIVGFAMQNKIAKLMRQMYYDIRPAANFCGSIAMLVVGYLFSVPALVFIIINFINARSNKELINQIEYNQKISGNR